VVAIGVKVEKEDYNNNRGTLYSSYIIPHYRV